MTINIQQIESTKILKDYIIEIRVWIDIRMSTISKIAREVYNYRSLLYSMVARNLKGKYKSSYLGFGWHFVTPAILIVVFYIVFTGVMQREIDHYWVYLCVGMFPFTFFQSNLGAGAGCVVSNAGTIKKMYFPREIVVFSQIISTFITLLIAYSVVIVLMLLSGYPFNIGALAFLPIILVLSVLFATGYVLFFSALTVFVRDVQFFIEATARILFWVTPIFYLASDVMGILSYIMKFNPFAYFIGIFHDTLYFGNVPGLLEMGVCLIISITAFVIGLIVFNKLKGKFAEEL